MSERVRRYGSWLRVALLVLCSVGSTACERFTTQDNLTATTTERGDIRVLFVPCGDVGVTSVTLAIAQGVPGDRTDDLPLWRIAASSSQQGVLDVVAGHEPPTGFQVALDQLDALETIDPSTNLVANVVTSTGVDTGILFEAAELRSGQLLTPAGEYLTHEDFLERATKACD